MNGYVLINETSGFPDLTRDKLLAIAVALQAQQVEVAAWWQRTPLEVIYADSEATAPQEDGWTLMKAVNALDDADALAYHTETTGGRPLILLGAQIIKANAPAGSDWVLGPAGFSTAASHEACETTANPYVSFYTPFDANDWVPIEICDATEGDTYEEGSIYVSNFLGPRWFSDGPGPYNRMGLIKAPREVRANGYVQKVSGGPNGTSTTLWGAAYPAWKRIAKAKEGTRYSEILARANGTDHLSMARRLLEEVRSAHGETLEDLVATQRELAFHKDAGAAIAQAHDGSVTELEQLRAELARLRAHPPRRGNGGVGG